MDEDDQTELDALRRRAYGPGDGLTDPGGIERLRELEARLHARHRVDPSTSSGTGEEPVTGEEPGDQEQSATGHGPEDEGARTPTGAESASVVEGPAPAARKRRWLRPALVAAAVVVVAGVVVPRIAEGGAPPESPPSTSPTADGAAANPLEVRFARQFTDDPQTRSLLDVRLLAAFDAPAPEPVPGFPVTGGLRWVDTVGDYFGARVWRGRADDDEVCLLIQLPTVTRATCVPDEVFELDATLVIAPYLEIPEAERPGDMKAGDELGFWWRSDGRLQVLLAKSATESAAD
ncbi:MAG: hypothetical protein ABW024_03835 [Microbacterium sp.]